MMENPYKLLGDAKVEQILEGGRQPANSITGKLSERLRQYAFYVCEQQSHTGDALLSIDLHDAAKHLRKLGL